MKSKYSQRWKKVPIPEKMAHLPKDHRGYPIPDNIFKDDAGKYHFIINDQKTRDRHIENNLCAICGNPLKGDAWLVGGPLSALHPNGAYNDTCQHEDCVKYALQVCPFMAMKPYVRPDPEKVTGRVQSKSTQLFVDLTQLPGQPPVFILIRITGYELTPEGYLRPDRPYLALEAWSEGRKLDFMDPRDALQLRMNQIDVEMPDLLTPDAREYIFGGVK